MLKKLFKITVIMLAILWIGGYGAFIYNISIKKTPITEFGADSIIVLTGGNNRIKTGLELLSAGVSDNLFISGVHASVTKEDIISMWDEDKNLPDCCITLGYQATTTIENALESKEWIAKKNIKTVLLVTSNYHIDRANLEFKNIMKDTTIIPHPVKESRTLTDIHFWKITFSEYNKFLLRYIITKFKG